MPASKKVSKAARTSLKWGDWPETIKLRQFYYQILMQAAGMVSSGDAVLAAEGRKILKDAAERVAEAEIYKLDQANRRRDRPGSSDLEIADDERNKRIRAAYIRAEGERGVVKRLAIEFDLSTRAISTIVKEQRQALKAGK